jgi:hypothetical protein
MEPAVALGYLEHLTAADLRVLGEVAGVPPEALRARPARLLDLLAAPTTEAAVLDPAVDEEPFLRASSFLTFAVAVHRSAARLEGRTSTLEWVGPHQRLPVFDVASLRDFLADPLRRLFLVELLASFTSVTSGSTWERTRRGWRRRRFSELDPVRLASLLEVVGEAERPGVYRPSVTWPCSSPACSPTTPPSGGSAPSTPPACSGPRPAPGTGPPSLRPTPSGSAPWASSSTSAPGGTAAPRPRPPARPPPPPGSSRPPVSAFARPAGSSTW